MLRLVQLPEFCHSATILSVRFPFRTLFSVKSDWILGCTARDLRSEGTKGSAAMPATAMWVKWPDR